MGEVEIEGEPIYVVAGKWNRSTAGEWEFSIDPGTYGNFITLQPDDSLEAYKSRVSNTFSARGDNTCRLTYLAPAKVSSVAASKMPPICIGNEDGLKTFKLVSKRNEGFSLYVEFDKPVDAGVNVTVGSAISQEGGGSALDIPPKLSQTGAVGTFQQLLLSQQGGSGLGSNTASLADTDKGDTSDINYSGGGVTFAAAVNDVESAGKQPADAILKETQTFDFLGSDGYDSEQELCLNGQSRDFDELLPAESDRSDSRSYDSDGSRYRSDEDDDTEGTSAEAPRQDSDRLDVGQWTQMINMAYDDVEDVEDGEQETTTGGEEQPIMVFGSAPNPSVQNGATTSEMRLSLEKIYADIRDQISVFARDAEPMFDDEIKGGRELADIDILEEDGSIYKGRMFKTKRDLQVSMNVFAMKRLFHFKSPRSTKKKLVMECVDPRCDWRVMAAVLPHSSYFEVRKAYLEHSCDITSRMEHSKHATSRVIAELLRKNFGNGKTGPRPRDMPDIVKDELQVTVSYWKAWRAREMAIQEIHGSAEGSYKLLPQYLYLMRHANRGTVYHLQTTVAVDGARRFQYLFFAFGASIQGIPWMRKVIVVDGTQLWGKYMGCMMTASFQDGNLQIFPLAFEGIMS